MSESQCDMVHVQFETDKAVQLACRIFLETAAGDLGSRKILIATIQQAFPAKISPGDSAKVDGKGQGHDPSAKADKLLSDLRTTPSPRQFAGLCIKASLLHWKISQNLWVKTQRQVQRGAARILPPPPRPDRAPFWLGSAADRWISVPARLAFAEPVVGLCRRIAEINTCVTTLRLEAGELHSLQLHLQLFTECKPLSFRIPGDDLTDTFCHELQKILE